MGAAAAGRNNLHHAHVTSCFSWEGCCAGK
jgi:hypothetical protein